MKKLTLIIFGIQILFNCLAQSPQKFSYQAIIRDDNEHLVTDKQVGVRITILQGATDGTPLYTESHEPSTNSNGLVSIEIGSGNTLDDFSSIDWSIGTYYIKSEIDPDISDGTNYSIVAINQLLSVPYALYAEKAGNIEELARQQALEDTAASIRNDIPDINNFVTYNDLEDTISQLRSEIPNTEELATIELLNDSITAIREDIPDANNLVTSNDLEDAKTELRSEIPNVEDLATKEVFNDSIASIREDIPAVNNLVTSTDLNNAESQLRSEIPDISNMTSQNALEDTAASIRGDLSLIDGSETHITAGENIKVTGEGTNANPYIIATDFSESHYVGELYGGGVIFYIDETKNHGLIVSLEDLSTTATWGANGATNSASTWDGLSNTVNIIACGQASGTAAQLADVYTGGGYSDWYLPSIDELNLLYNSRYQIDFVLEDNGGDGLAQEFYWSSTVPSDSQAYQYRFNYGRVSWENRSDGDGIDGRNSVRVRAVRQF